MSGLILPGKPSYRGALCHGGLAAVTADGERGARVLASVDPEHLRTIRAAGRLAWLSAVALDEINAAYLREAGAAGYLDFWRRYTVGAVETTLFGGLFNGALRIFGRSPSGLLNQVDRSGVADHHPRLRPALGDRTRR